MIFAPETDDSEAQAAGPSHPLPRNSWVAENGYQFGFLSADPLSKEIGQCLELLRAHSHGAERVSRDMLMSMIGHGYAVAAKHGDGDDTRPVAFAAMAVIPSMVGRIALVEDPVIHPGHCRKGLEARLVGMMEERARAAGIDRFEAVFRHDIGDRQHDLYSSLGYELRRRTSYRKRPA